MAQLNVPNDVTVTAFFTEYLPSQFAELIAGKDLSSMAGKEFTLQFAIDDQCFCLKIKDGQTLNVIQGGVDKPMLTMSMTEKDWREAVTGKLQGVIDRFIDPGQAADPKRLAALASTKGTLNLALKRHDGANLPITMVFNGEPLPMVTLNLDLPDWVSIQNGETTGQALFMNGKLRFTGDMVLLMKLQTMI
jgi:putative sterol carrier protein